MSKLALLLSATGFALLIVVGCQSDGPVGPAGGPPINTDIVDIVFSAVDGNNQTGAVGRELPVALVAKLTDMNGNPIVGYAVNWVILEGGGAVSPATTVTDADGETRNSWTLGPEPGTNAVEVRSMNPSSGTDLTHGTFIANGVYQIMFVSDRDGATSPAGSLLDEVYVMNVGPLALSLLPGKRRQVALGT